MALNTNYANLLRTCSLSELPEVLERIGDVNVRGYCGQTALHDLNDSPERCKLLVEHGACVNLADIMGRTPLHYVTNVEICKILVEHGADVNARDDCGYTPLFFVHDDEEHCKIFLENGADVNARTLDSDTPLHCNNNEEVCKLLLENGADIDAIDKHGNTPLMRAIQNIQYDDRKDFDMIYFYLFHNADARIVNDKRENALSHYIGDLLLVGRFDLIETLFLFTYDENNEPISWNLISHLGQTPELRHIFKKILATCSEIEPHPEYTFKEQYGFLEQLFKFDEENFILFPDKFKNMIVRCFKYFINCQANTDIIFIITQDFTRCQLILSILIEFDLLTDSIGRFQFLVDCQKESFLWGIKEVDQMTKLLLIFMSYGLDLSYEISNRIYNRFGYCELFRILLHCDLSRACHAVSRFAYSRMARCIYELDCTIDICMDDSWPTNGISNERALLQLLEQFAHPKLFKFCLDESNNCGNVVVAKVHRMSKIPKLLELARNVARQHIIDTFDMEKPSQFYTYIDHLEISQVYKDILSYRRKIYRE